MKHDMVSDQFCRFHIADVSVKMPALKFSTMFHFDLLWLSFAAEFLFIAHAVVVYCFHHSLYISVTIGLCNFCALGLLPSFGFCAACNWCVFLFTFPLFTCVWIQKLGLIDLDNWCEKMNI